MPALDVAPAAIAGWRLYYADGTTHDGARGGRAIVDDAAAWVAAPLTGVLVLVLFLRNGFRLVVNGADPRWNGADYYWRLTADGTFGAGRGDEVPAGAVVKAGTLVPDPVFWAVYNVAKEARV